MPSSSEGAIFNEIGIIGAGRLGSSLALALTQVGERVTAVAGAGASGAEALAVRLPGARSANAAAVARGCGLVVLAVPDTELPGLAAGLAWRAGQSVVHCSGALDLEVLAAVAHAGGLRGCLHPLQAFPARFEPERFTGIVCGIEADAPLDARLQELCLALGARSVRLEGVSRARYHAAAVLASNFVVALHAAAARAWTLSGLPEDLARSALAPLTLGAAEAVSRLPLEAALTGPFARGDVQTVASHLRALEAAPELRALYLRLGAELLGLQLDLPDERRTALEALLSGVV
ncbi:MAG: Rossmann-like and DUF2520 domain-containing protein [Polyangiales bacterium]